MSIASTVFVRVTAQDRGRGFQLLAGFDSKIILKTATRVITMSYPTRPSLDEAIAKVTRELNASDVKDVTADGIKRQLRFLFDESTPTKIEA